MSFWSQNQKQIMLRWEQNRRRIEREVAERRRDLVRRNMRQSSEWNNYEPYTDWYLEREVAAFIEAVEEVSSIARQEIDDRSLDEMDQMLVEMIEQRRQIASADVLREFGTEHARVKGSARVGLLSVQSRRRSERERGIAPASPPPVQRRAPSPVERASAGAPATATAPKPGVKAVLEPSPEAPAAAIDVHTLADHLRRLAQLIQRLPDAEEQAETLEELQFVAEEATIQVDQRKLRMVAAALERIRARISAADPDAGPTAAAHAIPIRRWFELTA